MNNIFKNLALVLSVLVVSVIVGCAVLAWTEPGATPPGGTVAAPINTGSIAQTKSGDLNIGGLAKVGNGLTITSTGTAFALMGNQSPYNNTIWLVAGQDGSIGLNTTNPTQKLDVNGNVTAKQFCLSGVCCSTWTQCFQ